MSAWSVCHHLTPGGAQVHYTADYTMLVLWSLTQGATTMHVHVQDMQTLTWTLMGQVATGHM